MSEKVSGPWAAFYDAEASGLLPGYAAALRRAEAMERAEELRRREEARDRAELRLEAWTMRRMAELSARGIAFDPGDLSTLVESPAELAERVFAHQDAAAARQERRALIEAGVLTELGPMFAGEATPAGGVGEAPEVHSSPTSPAASRAREFLHRFARAGARTCVCRDCVKVRAERVERKRAG